MADSEAVGRLRTASRTVLRTAGAVSAGLAVVLLVGAAALALWSRLIAPRTVRDGDWPEVVERLHRLGDATPDGLAIAVCVVAAVLLAAMAVARWRGARRRRSAAGVAVWAAVAAVVAVAYLSVGVPAFSRAVMRDFPAGPAVPGVVAAWVLTAAGVLAALAAAPAVSRPIRASRLPVAVGALVGVVAVSVATVLAVRAGEDGRFVDATIAAPAEVPPMPTALGERRFTVTVPDAFDAEGFPHPRYSVAAAGAGFVVALGDTVTAYGADGSERWHFRRTGPGNAVTAGMRVLDGGATVAVLTLDAGVVALDAVTGRQLWAGGPALRAAATERSGIHHASPFLVERGDREWTRYDARTGRPMWTVPAPHEDCRTDPADTGGLMVSLAICPSEDTVDVRLTALDPATGATAWDAELAADVPMPEDHAYVAPMIQPAGAAGEFVVFFDEVEGGQLPREQYVDVVGRKIVPLPDVVSTAYSVGPRADFLARVRNALVLYDARGTQRCRTAGDVSAVRSRIVGSGMDIAYLAFELTFVVYDYDRKALVTYDSATCREVSRVPTASIEGFLPAPGANLVLRMGEGRTVEIDGYGGG